MLDETLSSSTWLPDYFHVIMIITTRKKKMKYRPGILFARPCLRDLFTATKLNVPQTTILKGFTSLAPDAKVWANEPSFKYEHSVCATMLARNKTIRSLDTPASIAATPSALDQYRSAHPSRPPPWQKIVGLESFSSVIKTSSQLRRTKNRTYCGMLTIRLLWSGTMWDLG